VRKSLLAEGAGFEMKMSKVGVNGMVASTN